MIAQVFGGTGAMTANLIATAAVFVVADLRRSVDWYSSRLDFHAAELNWDENPTFTIVEREGAAIMLKQGRKAGLANRHLTPGLALFDAYIWVQNLDKVALTIKVGGTPLFAGPTKRAYGCTEIMVEDPDGYLICFGYCP